ncbi:MAG: SIMPL domain-containing protein, partial [Vicinamibacterales bacterium]
KAGLPGDAIRTVSIELTPEFDYTNGRQQLRGYVARNSVELRIDALDRLGEVIDAAVGTGATNVAGVRFDVKRREELERDALRQAVGQARTRAEAMAAGAGRSIDRIVRIEDSETPIPFPRPVPMAARTEMAVEAFTPVAPGELEIRARVTVTAALK